MPTHDRLQNCRCYHLIGTIQSPSGGEVATRGRQGSSWTPRRTPEAHSGGSYRSSAWSRVYASPPVHCSFLAAISMMSLSALTAVPLSIVWVLGAWTGAVLTTPSSVARDAAALLRRPAWALGGPWWAQSSQSSGGYSLQPRWRAPVAGRCPLPFPLAPRPTLHGRSDVVPRDCEASSS